MTRKTLKEANYFVRTNVNDDDDISRCLNCAFEYHGRCNIHNVKVNDNGYCDDYD